MDSDDLDGDLNLSDDESGARERQTLKAAAAKAQDDERVRYAVEFDTNVFKVKLECLQSRGQLVTGDAEFCANCKGVFNKTSVMVDEADKQIWACEFCNHRNDVMIGPEEVPTSDEVTYLLEAAAQVEEEEKKEVAAKVSDTISVVFCIDISGSMQQAGRLEMCKRAVAA